MTRSDFILRLATAEEIERSWDLNHEMWGGGLTPSAYFKRERCLLSQALTRDGGMLHWVLFHGSDPDNVLSFCETIRKEAIVKYRDGSMKHVYSYGIGAVYTPREHRGRGYGSRMVQMLGEKLECMKTVSVAGKTEIVESPFSVLYSDIGKKFYSKIGWHAHHSVHAELPMYPQESDPEITPEPVFAADIPSLCSQDTEEMFSRMATASMTESIEARVAFLCTEEVIRWHHAREEFLSGYFYDERLGPPQLKGAISRSRRQWVIWTRIFAAKKLVILRYVDLDKKGHYDSHTEKKNIIRGLLSAAMNEAAKWNLTCGVHIWNPSETMREVILDMGEESEGAAIVNRDQSSIPCLRWNRDPGLDSERVVWEDNEFYSWC